MKSLPILQDLDKDDARKFIALKLRKVIGTLCKRILIIHPPHISEADFRIGQALNNRYWSYQPYGPGVLSRSLRERGYETYILDLNYEVLAAAHVFREKFDYSSWKDMLRNVLDDFNPHLVGISCMFTMSHAIMKEISEAIKTHKHDLTVIAGGVHTSNAREKVLRDCLSIDFAGVYECDRSLPDMIDFVNGKVGMENLTQIATLEGDSYIAVEDRATPEVEDLQFSPFYHDLPIGNYNEVGQIGTYGFMRKGRKAASVLSNRGCRAHCSFCSVASFNGPGVRLRSHIEVVDEIEELYNRYGIRHITWLDDDLLFDKKRTMALFNEIERRKMDLTWDASNGLIAAFITPENMEAMVRSGCVGFNLGIESGNPEILRSVHKPGTVDSFRKCKAIVDKYPQVFVKGFLIIGFPNETLNMMLDTINLGIELSLDWYSIQLLNPLPSTEIYGTMMEQGLIQDGLQTSNVAFVFGPHGRQKVWEEQERAKAVDFRVNFSEGEDLNRVPNEHELRDYWFFTDFKLNFEKLLDIHDLPKILKIGGFIEDIAVRIAPDNPIAHLFLAVIDKKLGNVVDIPARLGVVRKLIEGHAYWQKRFTAFRLYDLMERLSCV